MVLSSIPGVSERMASKMTAHFGSEDAVMSTLASGDIARLAEVEGLSAKRALSLARHYAGDDGHFLATKEARKLHQNLITHLQGYASFPASQERMGLLMPVRNPEQRRGLITAALELDPAWLEQQVKAWQGLRRLREKQERYERVVVSPEPLDALKKHCRVLQPGDDESWKDYTVFKTVTWLGPGAPMEAPEGWLVLGSSPDLALVLPERTIDWFVHNKGVLGVLCDLVESQQRNELPENAALASLKEALLPLGKLPEAMNRLSDDSQIEEVVAQAIHGFR